MAFRTLEMLNDPPNLEGHSAVYGTLTEADKHRIVKLVHDNYDFLELDIMKDRYSERIKFLLQGGRIKCPKCEDGYIKMKNENLFICDKYSCYIARRIKFD